MSRPLTAPSCRPRILVIEDDAAVRLSLNLAARKEGFEVAEAGSAAEALVQLRQKLPDLVLLDLMLPEPSGFGICREIRQTHPDLPVIILTARGDEVDKVVGLELGADDYITKPFSPRELVARIRAVLRRSGRGSDPSAARPPEPARSLRFGALTIDLAARTVQLEGRDIALTRTEFDLLAALGSSPGQVWTRDDLVRRVWGYQAGTGTRLLDSHVAHLRAKLEGDPSRPRYIHTVRDVGYRFNAS